ncbi:hypothetical protein SLA2020_439120 [Shorea laevis]
MMGKTSVVWLRKTMEDLIKGAEIKDFYRYDVFWECYIRGSEKIEWVRTLSGILEYGGGGWRGFIVFPEGHEGRGWVECATQLRKVQDFFYALVRYGSTSNNARLGATAEESVVSEEAPTGGG